MRTPQPSANGGAYPGRLGTLGDIALLASASGCCVALRVVERAEFWHDRTITLVAIAAIGGAGGMGLARIGLRWALGDAGPIRRALFASGFFTFGLIFAMGIAFVVQTLGIAGHHEASPGRVLVSIAYSAPQTFGLFLISVPGYLLPWPLPVLTALAAWRTRRLAPVEPAPSLV